MRLNPGDAEILVLSGQVIEAGVKVGAEIQVGSVRQPATAELALSRYKAAVQMNDNLASAWLAFGLLSASTGHAQDAKMAIDKLTALGDPASAALVSQSRPTAAASPKAEAPALAAPVAEVNPTESTPVAPAIPEAPAADPSLPATSESIPADIPAAEPLPMAAPAP